jgi:hypothetical protein
VLRDRDEPGDTLLIRGDTPHIGSTMNEAVRTEESGRLIHSLVLIF